MRFRIATPHRRQIDPIECGAVCLGIILEARGRYVDTKTLRIDSNVTRNGADAESLLRAAHLQGLEGFAKKAVVSDLKTVTTPAILFVDNCHFVVFEGVRHHRYYLNDPALGRYAIDEATMRKRFSRIVLQFREGEKFTKTKERTSSSVCSDTLHQIAAIVFALIGSALFVLCARLVGLFHLLSHDQRDDVGITFALLWIAIFTGLSTALYGFYGVALRYAHHHAQSDAEKLLTHLFDVSPTFFDDRPFFLFERAFIQSADYQLRSSTRIATTFWSAFLAVILVALFTINAVLGALVVMSLALLSCAYVAVYRRRHRPAQTSYVFSPLHLHTLAEAKTLLAMGHRELIIDGLLRSAHDSRDETSSSSRSAMVIMITVAVLLVALNVAALPLWRAGDLSIARFSEIILLAFGVMFAASMIAERAASPSQEFRSLIREMQASQKIMHIVDDGDAPPIDIRDVHFHFPGENDDVLQSISYALARKEVVGVVGGSRSGVSTFFKILAGQLEPTHGAVLFSREHGRVVLINTEGRLRRGPLRDVITLGDQSIADATVVDALRAASAADLFYNRPMGLLAKIHDDGQNLSISERFRLMLAQALVHKPDVIILDDFFSVIEQRIAKEIIAALRAREIAAVFNSYDGALLSATDRVVFLREGRVHKIDRHEHLYFGDEAYRELVKQSIVEDAFV